jgi:hypothetical protein
MSRSEFEKKTYLGDGVYSEFDGYQIKLTTEIGSLPPTNTIYLEPDVVINLMEHINRVSLYRGLKKETNDPSIISPSELDRCLHSDPNDTGWTK